MESLVAVADHKKRQNLGGEAEDELVPGKWTISGASAEQLEQAFQVYARRVRSIVASALTPQDPDCPLEVLSFSQGAARLNQMIGIGKMRQDVLSNSIGNGGPLLGEPDREGDVNPIDDPGRPRRHRVSSIEIDVFQLQIEIGLSAETLKEIPVYAERVIGASEKQVLCFGCRCFGGQNS